MRLTRWVAAAAIAAAAPACADGTPPPVGLCASPEKVFFACMTASSRWISLCGTPPSALQYRFGRAAPELQFPERAADGMKRFLFAHYGRYQTERIELRFDNQGAEYVLFDYQESGKHTAGVRVVTGGKSREFACSGPIASRLGELQPLLQCDADSALNGGNCP